jgi:DNA ligase-associated metallophosphoesterase
MKGLEVDFAGKAITLLPQRAVFIRDSASLLIADPHFGKSGHFRKAGIPVSGQVLIEDLLRLSETIAFCKAEKLYILGDFFHAEPNQEWSLWCTWLEQSSLKQAILIPGNHDRHIVKLSFPKKMIKGEMMHDLEGLALSHDETETTKPLICGHVHPSVHLSGIGKQGLKMPCFYMKKEVLILPAFGSFTGTYQIKASRGERLFIPVNEGVMEVKSA